jgi:hypothetical protein
MTCRIQAWLWASAIIAAALVSNWLDLSNAAGLLIIIALSGAAIASLRAGRSGATGCR